MPNEPNPQIPGSRIKEIFVRAVELGTTEERQAYLVQACGNDQELRRMVESLLQVHETDARFLSRNISGEELDPLTEGPGTVIGPYRLVERLGEGGFGVVYRAEQTEPVKREVALKIIKAGMDTKEVITRFEAERQALALMDHPNITRVFEAGATETGRPYFVMELACGEPITRYCDIQRLPVVDRLKLFQQVCAAVQHAHQKGIIHRDLKPSNIVVIHQDGQGVPKIIDFGIAKSLQGRLTDRTLVTQREVMLGTPAYMSPEQVSVASEDLDTRTDVYSLGVLLYELIAGVTPFESDTLRKAALAEVQRIIREVEPPRPSTRLRALGAKATEVAARRAIEPPVLERTLQGDLDWIVMKAIDKDRARRYESAAELAREIQRHVSHEPVHAGPPKAAYRARKFIRRHRLGVAVAAAVTAALIIGFGAALIGFAQARRAQRQAQHEAAIAKAINKFLQEDLLRSAVPWNRPQREVTLQTVLDRASETVSTRFGDQPLVEAEVRMTLSECYQALGLYPEARVHLDRAREIYEERLPPDDPRRLKALCAEAQLLVQEGHPRESQMLWERLLPVHRRVFGPEAEVTLRVMSKLAESYYECGRFAEAQECAEEVLAAQRRVLGPEHEYTLKTATVLAEVYLDQNRLDEAQILSEEILAVCRRIWGPDNFRTLESTFCLATTLLAKGKAAEAEQLFDQILPVARRLYGPEHPFMLLIMRRLARTYTAQGRFSEAQKMYEDVLETSRRVWGPEHPDTLRTMHEFAFLYFSQGQLTEAHKLNLELLPAKRRVLGPEHPETLDTMNNLACVLAMCADPEVRNGQSALDYAEQVVTATGRTNAQYLVTLALAYAEVGQFTNAARVQQEAIGLLNTEEEKRNLAIWWQLYHLATAIDKVGARLRDLPGQRRVPFKRVDEIASPACPVGQP